MNNGQTKISGLSPGVLQLVVLQLHHNDFIPFAMTCSRFKRLLLDKRFMSRTAYKNLYFKFVERPDYGFSGLYNGRHTILPNGQPYGYLCTWSYNDRTISDILLFNSIIYNCAAIEIYFRCNNLYHIRYAIDNIDMNYDCITCTYKNDNVLKCVIVNQVNYFDKIERKLIDLYSINIKAINYTGIDLNYHKIVTFINHFKEKC